VEASTAVPGSQFASPHSYRSVRNTQTTMSDQFAEFAETLPADSQTDRNQEFAKFADGPVRGSISVCGRAREQKHRPRTEKSGQERLNFGYQREGVMPRTSSYDTGNLRAARIILGERQRYERECRFLVLWAELVIQRLGSEDERKAA
jgi:hypothetical protein